MAFNAMVVRKDEEGKTSAQLEQLELDQLPDGDVTIAVEYSTLNYKDGLCLGAGWRFGAQLPACAGH